jgi:hypothetical protein
MLARDQVEIGLAENGWSSAVRRVIGSPVPGWTPWIDSEPKTEGKQTVRAQR